MLMATAFFRTIILYLLLIAGLRLMTDGVAPKDAIAVSITNKCFDEYEYELVRDVALTRFA